MPSVVLVQPSSLIFVLVVAIWAVYLLQYWIKRRDHLSTVRSVDRFSAAMRVLDDHRMARSTAEPMPRSYAVAPTRAARPEVTVKHAEAPRAPHAVRSVHASHDESVGVPRRVRGLTFVTAAVLLPVVIAAALLTPLPWWSALIWGVVTVGTFAWLRQAVVAERVARRARPVPHRTSAARAAAARAERPVAVSDAPPTPAATPTETVEVAERPARSTRVYDVAEEQEPAVEETAAQAPASEAEPGTWQPTPVPRPMYTMKAKAEAPVPAPAPAAPAPEPAADVPQVIDVEDEDLPAIAGWG